MEQMKDMHATNGWMGETAAKAVTLSPKDERPRKKGTDRPSRFWKGGEGCVEL